MQKAKGIPCGNTWEQLSSNNGNEKQRLCQDCDKAVINLNGVSQEEFKQLCQDNSKGRCVVNQPVSKRQKLSLIACSLFSIIALLMNQSFAQKPEPKELKPLDIPDEKTQDKPLRHCESLLFTPMAWPDPLNCLDEKGEKTKFMEWRKTYDYNKLKQGK